ncbi:MAG: PAS domain-containing protein [Actinomycetota bacterium]
MVVRGILPPPDRESLLLNENAYDMVGVLLPDRRADYVSAAVEPNLGYRPEELVGKNVLDYIHPEDRPGVAGMIAKAFDEPGYVGTIRFRHGDGGWRTLEAVGRNLLDDPLIRGSGGQRKGYHDPAGGGEGPPGERGILP